MSLRRSASFRCASLWLRFKARMRYRRRYRMALSFRILSFSLRLSIRRFRSIRSNWASASAR